MIKFFENTLQSDFVKQLLLKTPLPTIPTVTDGDIIVSGHQYIYKTQIIRCDQTGILNGELINKLTVGEGVFVSNDLILDSSISLGFAVAFTTGRYDFGKWNFGVSSNFVSNTSYYDCATHEELGHYLRCIRDIYGVDLMPFYNCFSYRSVENIELGNPQLSDPSGKFYKKDWESNPNSLIKTFAVPVLFNKTYNIALESDVPVYIKPALYGYYKMLSRKVNGKTQYLTDLLNMPVTIKTSSNFGRAFTINTNIQYHPDREYLMKFQKNFYLIIQLPINYSRSLVILEGDYNNNYIGKNRYVISAEGLDKVYDQNLNRALISRLSLMSYDDGTIYPCSKRLIEYLLSNTIDSTETNGQNLAEMNLKLNPNPTNQYNTIWNNESRFTLFYDYLNSQSKQTKFDSNGFVDKDSEDFLDKLKYKESN